MFHYSIIISIYFYILFDNINLCSTKLFQLDTFVNAVTSDSTSVFTLTFDRAYDIQYIKIMQSAQAGSSINNLHVQFDDTYINVSGKSVNCTDI